MAVGLSESTSLPLVISTRVRQEAQQSGTSLIVADVVYDQDELFLSHCHLARKG
jgi:hypothetical protein